MAEIASGSGPLKSCVSETRFGHVISPLPRLRKCVVYYRSVLFALRNGDRLRPAVGAVEQWLNPQPAREWQSNQQPQYQQQVYQPRYQQPLIQQQIHIQQSYGYAAAPAPVYPGDRKDKTVAVLLAVFLGLWTWVYTCKKDAWKFWAEPRAAPHSFQSAVDVGAWVLAEHRASLVGDHRRCRKTSAVLRILPDA